MNKFAISALFCGALFLLPSCGGSNDEPTPDDPKQEVESKDLDFTTANSKGWLNYSVNVAQLLVNDAKSLNDSWNTSYNGGVAYKEIFRNHNNSNFGSALSCIEQILDGCSDIANEVGEAKIGDPYQLYVSGRREEALYAVESWYSWHSRDDYSNNILSIRNSYFGALTNSASSNSMASLVAAQNADLDTRTRSAITAAYDAIQSIPQPFRNNINSSEAVKAMDACEALRKLIDSELKPFFQGLGDEFDGKLHEIVVNYVDNVVIPTYSQLQTRNQALLDAVKALQSNPSNSNFNKACDAWLNAREPWEKSEAFLFGPVDALGLDPNMDSWPLDQDAIVKHLQSGSFDDLNWTDGDSDDKVEAVQSIRGFHTLEFLLFKDGQPRTAAN